MKAYLLNQWDKLRSSFWFVPTLFGIGAVLLSIFMPEADYSAFRSDFALPGWVSSTTDAARTSLAAMAGAVVTVTATVFSITIVTLSLASQQLGPRLLRRFMHDLTTQYTLGIFISTSIYCLLILRLIQDSDNGPASLPLSVLTAVVMTGLSISALILFIHHVAVLIQATEVVAAVAGDLDESMVRLFPKDNRELPDTPTGRQAAAQSEKLTSDYSVIRSKHEGYIQSIDVDRILEIAVEADLIIKLLQRPGYFVTLGEPFANVWSGVGLLEEKDSEELTNELNSAVISGTRRTPRQDLEFSIAELVEIAVRSLSPGTNDPFTAMACIDRLGASIGRLAELPSPTPYGCDKSGQLRLIAPIVCFAEVLDLAFDQIRQYGRSSVSVTYRLLHTFGLIGAHIHRHEDRMALLRQVEMVGRHAQDFPEHMDRERIRNKVQQVTQTLTAEARLDHV